ncbi:MAG: hypothetical protein WBJ43_07920 [Smithellaceae bacterium]|nr:hypothetical protein [Syntrophaceae bacterium]MBP8609418.1 hypothetical protein [Syntrophaceae bacterium]NMD04250.1 hypothetical protein [Deltaproteobacteria bacterium]
MPVYAQIVLLIIAFFIFVFLIMYLSGLGIRRLCFKIIEEMEEKNAFNVAKAVKLQEKRRNILSLGTKNPHNRALNVLISEGLVIKTSNNKYYLDIEKITELRKKR